MSLAPGSRLGVYTIVAPLGEGGMGTVYRARDPRLDRDVALKVADAQFSERFTREAKTIAALNHANICHLYDVGPDYLVMELVEGRRCAAPSRSPTRCRSSASSSTASRPPTRRASSTATSSRPTSRSPPTAW